MNSHKKSEGYKDTHAVTVKGIPLFKGPQVEGTSCMHSSHMFYSA